MYIMQKLPTNKANFIFKNTQDFNQTTHVGPQDPNVFTDNISFYFYPIISIKTINETVMQRYVTVISTQSEKFPSFEVEYTLQMQNACFSTWSFSTWIAQQFQNGRRQ